MKIKGHPGFVILSAFLVQAQAEENGSSRNGFKFKPFWDKLKSTGVFKREMMRYRNSKQTIINTL